MPLTRTMLPVPLAVLLAVAAWSADDPLSRAAADRLITKAEALRRNAEASSPTAARVVVTETELNSYLAFDGPDQLPAGVAAARLRLESGGRVTARAIVDLDAVQQARGPGSWLDPLTYLRGRLPVAATGVVTASSGRARVALERAEVSGLPVPRIFLQELVTCYTRSPQYPNGIGLDDPFPLPARIRSITVDRGAAVVEQ